VWCDRGLAGPLLAEFGVCGIYLRRCYWLKHPEFQFADGARVGYADPGFGFNFVFWRVVGGGYGFPADLGGFGVTGGAGHLPSI